MDRDRASADEAPAAFWCRVPSRPNFGDALTPWLIHRISGRYPRFRRADGAEPALVVTGSVIHLAGPHSTVWGAGIMSADDEICPAADIRAVRGPRTRRRALECGADCPEVLGDPALLLPRLHAPAVSRSDVIGLAPHFSDRPRLIGPGEVPRWVHLLDMQDGVERVVDGIRACALVASTSLHGLIVAHAYGVPATWLEFWPLYSGDRSKFLDYFASIGHDDAEPLRITPRELQRRQLWSHAVDPPTAGRVDLDSLWDACPFRSDWWTSTR